MIIIFGRRAYGRVDACGSEYAQTTFVHLYYVPLFPTSSFWVTQEMGNQRTGHNIPLHGKSIAAAYLRVWAPIIAIAVASSAPVLVGAPLALALLAMSAWAWSWRSVRGELPVRRSDFNRLAYGMRCEPSVMAPEVRAQVAVALRDRWERSGAKRSPNDVGKFGATDPGEAVTAYGLLRLSAYEHGGRDEREAAERILRGTHDALPAEDGPYRDTVRPAPAAVHTQIASAAATVEAQRGGAVHAALAANKRAKAPFVRAKRIGLAAVIVAAVSIAGLADNTGALHGVATGTIDQVVATSGDGDFATVSCAHADLIGDLETGSTVNNRVFLCTQGERSIGLLVDADATDVDGPVTGRLARPSYNDRAWYSEIRMTSGIAPMYLKQTSVCAARVEAGLGLGGLGVALGLVLISVRSWRRAKRTAAA